METARRLTLAWGIHSVPITPLNSMDEIDREILSLRHFEQLSNAEAAQVLGLSEQAASNRFVRALKRLKSILSSAPGCSEEGA